MQRSLQSGNWAIPLVYSAAAIGAGICLPRIEHHLLPHLVSPLSTSAAMAIYSAIASGMISLTGIVFSLTFVMVQFSATAYSPRLALWIARSPVLSHALGIFSATFLYAVAALSGVDRYNSGRVPFISVCIVTALLFASVAALIALIHRIALLQVTRMLTFTGDQGRKVIRTTYPLAWSEEAVIPPARFRKSPPVQTLMYQGEPQALQAIDIVRLMNLARSSGAVIEIVVTVGDTIRDATPLLHVFGARYVMEDSALRNALKFGVERTFTQDPKYAIRLLVDIAIRALSPAINDPTTAVQALDQIEDLLFRLGCQNLNTGMFHDADDKLRLVIPFPGWEDFLRLALDEILSYGASSVQVIRRMNALVADLTSVLPEKRTAALMYWEQRLRATIARSFPDAEVQIEASVEDRQGLGIPRPRSTGTGQPRPQLHVSH